ncbi:MAG: heme biosynthesis HemY N-terminal domain-containing protein [Alphaproteobacteria bacterium]
MVRALTYLFFIVVTVLGLAWFADRPGLLVIEWQSYHIDVPLFRATVIIVLTVLVVLFGLNVTRKILGGPGRFGRHLVQKRVSRGYDALRKGIFAVGAGDEALAARFAASAKRALPKEPLAQLLLAQSAQLSGDRRTAQRVFEAMSEKPETQLLGLRGLFLEASHDNQMEAARQFAARALALNPALPWPVHSLFEMQCRERDWHGALETLNTARQHRHIDRKTIDRRRAVLLTAQALDLEDTQPEKAAELALEAHRLIPGFVPAAHIAGRILASRDSAHKAARVLAKTWQYTPHPDLALTYAYVRPGDSPRDRLSRIKSLIILTPDHPEARIALAHAAIDAREWEEARFALQPLLAANPTARVCTLMARIEGGEKRDAGRVREWLARAVRAPRDARWIADGVASEEWSPISPVTGKLDAFEWRVPADKPKSVGSDHFFEEISALGGDFEGIVRVAPSASDASAVSASETEASTAQALTLDVTVRDTATDTAKSAKVAVATANVQSQAVRPAVADATPSVQTSAQTVAEQSASTALPAETSGGTENKAKLTPASSSSGETRPSPAATTATAAAAKSPRTLETRIFVPSRPPDDPGPMPADSEMDDASTPVTRFRTASKQP